MKNYKNVIENINKATSPVTLLNGVALALSKENDVNSLKTLKLMLLAKENGMLTKGLSVTHNEEVYNYSKNYFINDRLYENLVLWNKIDESFNMSEFIRNNYVVDLTKKTSYINYDKPILEVITSSITEVGDYRSYFYEDYSKSYYRLKLIYELLNKGLLSEKELGIVSLALKNYNYDELVNDNRYLLELINKSINNYQKSETKKETLEERTLRMKNLLEEFDITDSLDEYTRSYLPRLSKRVKLNELYR